METRFWFLVARGIKDFFIPSIYDYLRLRLKMSASDKDEWAGYRGQKHEFSHIENAYRSSLISFIRVAQSWGIEPILMTQFNRINAEDELFSRVYPDNDIHSFIAEYERFNGIIKEVAQSEKVSLIDLAQKVPPTSEFIYDATHLNENGSLLVAEILTQFFEEKLKNSESNCVLSRVRL